MKKVCVSFLILISLVGCQKMHTTVQRIEFPIEEYQVLEKRGASIVSGQVFLKTKGGDVKFGVGNEVWLNPVTSYSKQWYQEAYLSGNLLTDPDPRYWDYVKKVIADGSGRFKFKNVAPGNYFLSSRVIWVAKGFQGGLICKKVSVVDGEHIEIMLTR